MLSLSLAQARRVALAAQGFGDPRPAGRVDARHMRRVLTRIGLLQLDSVNVFCRSHYLPVFARLGPYPRELLDELSAHTAGRVRRRELFEYWAHEASLVPVEHQPLLRWRMARAAESAWPGVRRIAREKPHLLEDILAMIEAEGPIRSSETGIAPIAPRPGHMWNWHDGKIALEYLFYAGRVTAARRVNFERYYDLPERVLPAEVLAAPTPEPADAFRELVRDLGARPRGRHRAGPARLLPAVAQCVEARRRRAGRVGRVAAGAGRRVGRAGLSCGTRRSARAASAPARCCHRSTRSCGSASAPSGCSGSATASRSTRPRRKRVYGYYVLPVLLGEALVGRVDLKSDRQAGVLRVQAAHLEDGHDPHYVATELAEELALTAQWLGLTGVVVMPRGGLAPYLAAAVDQAA